MKAFLLAGATAAVVIAVPAMAGGLGDWSLQPWTAEVSNLNVSVGGEAQGTAFSANQPTAAGLDHSGVSGEAVLKAALQRDYDSGLTLALKTSFEVYHDKLSADNYGGDLVQKVYAQAQTGLGRVELGMTDGAAYALAVTGPVVDGATTIDNSNATFFRDPSTGGAVTDIFSLNSAVESSLNYAKISYYTPRLFGVQIAASYTPSEGKEVIPFLSNGPHAANRQKSMWEAAVSYSDYFGPVSVGLYGGIALAHADAKTAGHAGLTDWGLGSELDYNLNDDIKLALGGAYRHSNTYTFDINDAVAGRQTNSAHLSTTLTDGPWIVGGEYGDGTAEGLLSDPVIGVRGYQASVGYVFNANLQATLGWQEMLYNRDIGTFYNGSRRIRMDAVYFHLSLHV